MAIFKQIIGPDDDIFIICDLLNQSSRSYMPSWNIASDYFGSRNQFLTQKKEIRKEKIHTNRLSINTKIVAERIIIVGVT